MLACMIPPGAIGPGVRHLWPRSRYRRARGVWSHSTLTEQYGAKNLFLANDFDWGMLNGKLSALRWVLGDDWDNLDT
jgi:hypothetical protein